MVKYLNIALAFIVVVLLAALYHIRYSAEAEAKAPIYRYNIFSMFGLG